MRRMSIPRSDAPMNSATFLSGFIGFFLPTLMAKATVGGNRLSAADFEPTNGPRQTRRTCRTKPPHEESSGGSQADPVRTSGSSIPRPTAGRLMPHWRKYHYGILSVMTSYDRMCTKEVKWEKKTTRQQVNEGTYQNPFI